MHLFICFFVTDFVCKTSNLMTFNDLNLVRCCGEYREEMRVTGFVFRNPFQRLRLYPRFCKCDESYATSDWLNHMVYGISVNTLWLPGYSPFPTILSKTNRRIERCLGLVCAALPVKKKKKKQ